MEAEWFGVYKRLESNSKTSRELEEGGVLVIWKAGDHEKSKNVAYGNEKNHDKDSKKK